jgi:hypothetical protein
MAEGARRGFRVFRVSVFPRCKCPLNSSSPVYWGGEEYSGQGELNGRIGQVSVEFK